MPSSQITLGELQAEIESLQPSPDGLYTMNELAESWGLCAASSMKRVRVAIKSGLMSGGHKKRIVDISGRSINVSAYRIEKRKGSRPKK